MTDPSRVPIYLSVQDWAVMRAGLLKLPGEVCIPILLKFDPQLQAKPEKEGTHDS